MPAILDSFYTTITNDHIGVEVRVQWKPWKWQVFPRIEVDTARSSHLRPIWALNITNSSQFDGQAFWPVMWRFPAGLVLVYSHHWHSKTIRALEHVRQAQERIPRKSRAGKQWQWYAIGLLVHWCRNQVIMKSQPCHCVCGSRLCQIRSYVLAWDNYFAECITLWKRMFLHSWLESTTLLML